MNEESEIFVRAGGGLVLLGTGFESEEEIEQQIEKRFGSGTYQYGTFEQNGVYEVAEPTYEGEDLDGRARRVLNELEKTCSTDERVGSFGRAESPTATYRASFHGTNIQYTVYDVDFSLTLDNALFEDVPLSTFNEDAEDQIIDILHELSEEVLYLGFRSGYANRGRKNPYVSVYGRVYRDTEQDREIRGLYENTNVETVLWSNENISPIPIRPDETYTFREEDIIVVLNREGTDSLDEITEENQQWMLDNAVEAVDSCETLTVRWLGKIGYGGGTGRYLCLGVETEEEYELNE